MRNPKEQKTDIDIDACYNRYGPMVLRRCRRLLGDEEKAFDAMQEVFVKLLEQSENLDGSYLSSLLYRIATNHCLNKLRNERRHQELDYQYILHHVPAIAHQDYGVVARNLLEYILKEEKKSTHRIAVMYFVYGMTLKEIASAEGMSVAGVHKRIDKVTGFLKNKGGQG
jgi:RNA polymerase sigma-70 factor, ECF subfamily